LHPHFVYRSASGAIAILLTAMVIANKTPISPEWVAVRAGTLVATVSSTGPQRFLSFRRLAIEASIACWSTTRGRGGVDHLEARHRREIRRATS